MRRFAAVTVLTAATILLGCSGNGKETTPKQEPAPQAEQQTEQVQEEPKSIPAEYLDQVEKVWTSAFTPVVTCVQQTVDEQNLKGIEGYIIVEAKIGESASPSEVRIKEVKMKKMGKDEEVKVTGFEKCITDTIKELSFPTWGYGVWDEHSYSISISY